MRSEFHKLAHEWCRSYNRDNDSNQANPPNNPPGPGGTQKGALQIGSDNRTVTGYVDVPKRSSR